MHATVPHGLLALITILYFVFIFQLWTQIKLSSYKNKDTRAITALMIVFIFCAFSGYASNLWDFPAWVVTGSHIILAVITGYLVLTNQSGHIAETLNNSGGDDDSTYRRVNDKRKVVWKDINSRYTEEDEDEK